MKAQEFCYWLQGYFEIQAAANAKKKQTGLSEQQSKMIQRHLALVFKHEIDPQYDGNQLELQNLHDGKDNTTPTYRC